jgi:hypothetical protein
MNLRNTATAGLLLAVSLTLPAQAALHDRGSGLIYDDVLNITWLQDANYAKTSGYDADGKMSWQDAAKWASDLSFNGHANWRLPSSLNADGSEPCGGYCSGSEMGHMFYNNMGASAGSGILTGKNTSNLALFTNLQSFSYWSSTKKDNNNAWRFLNNNGDQFSGYMHDLYYAWAVHDGDVAAVPEPETYTLMLAGLGLVGYAARRRKQAAA